jgi:arylsulfatase A-like enzyme
VRAAVLALVPLLAACPGPKAAPSPRPPAVAGNRLNVLLITIDTLRADHLGTYGYKRKTSPRIDALAREGAVFEQAYTYWPKTRGSFVAMLTGRLASQTGYSKTHPLLLGMNPTLAGVLKAAGYATAATVDNPNVAKSLGYAQGFDSYRETWEEAALATEVARAAAITGDGVRFLAAARPEQPFLLWLHYVNPHAPYTPPAPFDTAFNDEDAKGGTHLEVVPGFHGGVPKAWAVAGQDRLGYYVAQYDGEIATVDQEVGRVLDALRGSAVKDKTLVIITSDHGESLGEHDYFFDHGENLFDPSLRIPLVIAGPGVKAGHRSPVFASTLDLVPTVLDALKVSYPPELAGESLWPAAQGGLRPNRTRLQAQNDRNLIGVWDRRFKVVATPEGDRMQYALYDRAADPGETRDVASRRPEDFRVQRRELELFRERLDSEWGRTRRLVAGQSGEERLSDEACEKLKALNYIGVVGCK